MDPECLSPIVGYHEWDDSSPLCAIEEILLDADLVRKLCSPVMIPFPGVSIDEAAKRFGVNRTTIFRWSRGDGNPPPLREWQGRVVESDHVVRDMYQQPSPNPSLMGGGPERPSPNPSLRGRGVFESGGSSGFVRCKGRLVIDYYCKRNGRDLHRAEKYVWTHSPLDPSGEVWTAPWDQPGCDRTVDLPDDFSQTLLRTHRPLASQVYSRFLQCPQCESWNYKLFLPRPVWTVGDQFGQTQKHRSAEKQSFLCRKCAKLIYESAERTSRPAPGRRVNLWDRYVKRATAGKVRGTDVDHPDRHNADFI